MMLDFDGVFITPAGNIHERMHKNAFHGKWEMDIVALSMIGYLLKKNPDIKVVITSTWRMGHPLAELKNMLGPIIGDRVIGATPSLDGYRGREIKAWIDKYTGPGSYAGVVDDLIIIDDESDMNPYMGHLFKCHGYNGFQFTDYMAIEHYLKSGPWSKKWQRLNRFVWYNLRRVYYGWKHEFSWKLRQGWDMIMKRLKWPANKLKQKKSSPEGTPARAPSSEK